MKNAKGLFLVRKSVRVTHGKHITCGTNVKFEDYAEIHRLSKEGLVFGNNVTISRGVMIRPSSYYGGDLGAGLVMSDYSSIGPHGYVGCSGKITIGKNVMFGLKLLKIMCLIDGVTIGKGSVIGAGTLITKDGPAGSIVMDKRKKKIKDR